MSALVEPSQPFQYKFVSRVTSYPPISKVLETGKEYYNWGKESSSVVAYAESTVEGGIQWLAPKVEPLLETAKPLLVRADSFGCSALDKVETNAQKLRTNYEATREVLEQKVSNAKEVTYGAIGQVQQKYVTPVDEYLKDSLVAKPYNIALDVTEKVVDKILPNEEGQNENEITVRGPISKTAFLSKRIQQQAFLKLQNLSLRAPEKLNAMQYTVDLIKYAASSLDNGLISLNQTLNKGLEAGTVAIKEAPKEVKEKIQSTTHDALAALHTAVEVVAKQIPAEISTKFNQFKEATLAKGDESLNLFSQVAQSSSNLLHEVSGTIGEYVSRGETIPQQILSSAYTTLHKVLDSLMSVAEPKILWSSDSAGSQKKED